MTGIIRLGVTERGSFKKYSEAVHIPFFTKAVHNIKLPLTYSEFTCICRINLKQAHLQEQRLGYRMACNFPLMSVL